jgi:hypothetical protein
MNKYLIDHFKYDKILQNKQENMFDMFAAQIGISVPRQASLPPMGGVTSGSIFRC